MFQLHQLNVEYKFKNVLKKRVLYLDPSPNYSLPKSCQDFRFLRQDVRSSSIVNPPWNNLPNPKIMPQAVRVGCGSLSLPLYTDIGIEILIWFE